MAIAVEEDIKHQDLCTTRVYILLYIIFFNICLRIKHIGHTEECGQTQTAKLSK